MSDESFPDHWDNLCLFPEWYFTNEWYDVVTPDDTIDSLVKATEEMREMETDQHKRQELELILDGLEVIKDMLEKHHKEQAE